MTTPMTRIAMLPMQPMLAVLAVLAAATPAAAETGQEMFTKGCTACHTIGAGVRVGPDLAGVTQRRDAAWMLSFITSSQALVNSNDPTAVALFNQFNKVVMPNAPYSESQIKEIIAFLGSTGAGSTGAGSTDAATAGVAVSTAQADIDHGAHLFDGRRRFAARGPACASCHHVASDAVFGGGVLAKDLTEAFSRLNAAGIQAIASSPPFPVMQRAYRDKALQPEEVAALLAFLRNADATKATSRSFGASEVASKLFWRSVVGLVAMFALCALIWRRRRRQPINRKIFARQVASS